jgi:hypothetical protein
VFDKGLGVHANSELRLGLDSQYSRFQASIGVDDEIPDDNPWASVTFELWGDGVKLYDSGVLTASSAVVDVDEDVEGVDDLTLIVTDAGDGAIYDHADWADALLWRLTP